MTGVSKHCVRRDFTGVEIWSSNLWTARWSVSFVWIWNKDFGNAKRRPRKATAQLVPHQTTAVPTCMTFTGDKGAAFAYQRYMLGDVKTMLCVGPVQRNRLCLRWSFSVSFFVSWLPFIGPFIRALFFIFIRSWVQI